MLARAGRSWFTAPAENGASVRGATQGTTLLLHQIELCLPAIDGTTPLSGEDHILLQGHAHFLTAPLRKRRADRQLHGEAVVDL